MNSLSSSTDPNAIAISTYDQIADKYADAYFDDQSDLPYIDLLLEKLAPGAKILDVGSGPGSFSKYMSQKGFDVTGIDFSHAMVTTAKKRVSSGKFVYMDMRKLEFVADSFDGILAAYSLIHIPTEDIHSTFRGFFTVLKPNGYIEIITQKGKADQIVEEPFLPESPSQKMFINFFTKERLKGELEKAGFTVLSQHEVASSVELSMAEAIIYTIAKK